VAIAVAPLALWTMIPSELPLTRNVRTTLVAAGLFLAGALIGGGAWYAKNAALAGNPVYPLAYGIFGGKTRTPEKHAQWQRAHQVPQTDAGWRYSPSQLAGSLAQIAGRDPLTSPLLVPLAVAAIAGMFIPHWAIRTSHLGWLCFAALLWTFAVWWLVTHRIDRFLFPALPFAARWSVYCVLFVGFAYSLLANTSTLVGDNRWFVSLEQLRRDRPWPQHTPQRVKLSHQWLNENQSSPHAPREGISRSEMATRAVLLVGDAEPFDLEMPVFYNTCFDDCLLCDWLLNKSAAERHEILASRGVGWVLVDWPEIARYQSPGNYGFDPRFKAELLDEMVQQGVLEPPIQLGDGYNTRPIEIYPVRGGAPKPESPAGVQ
jgi:hypothetical protein